MKKLNAIIGLCMIGFITQAQPSNGTGSASGNPTENKDKSVKSEKHCDPQEMLAKINETIYGERIFLPANSRAADEGTHQQGDSAISTVATSLC